MSESLRIFVVDDDRDLAESLADLLEARGHTVELAFDGESAIARFRESDFDLVFMDVKMPGMNGVETFLTFRSFKPAARVVMMTGFSVEQLLQQAIDNGALAVLHKPVMPGDVLDLIDHVQPHGIVLIADDNPDFAASMEEILTENGYRAVIARTGEEAVNRVLEGGVECLILDLQLPVLNGLDVYLKLKRAGRAVSMIIVTGHADEESTTIDALRPVAHAILTKPVDPKQLLRRIDIARCAAP